MKSRFNLALMYPKVAQEWHPTKNGNFTPSDTLLQKCKFWWICEKGHEWEANIGNRTRLKSNCPYCSGRLASQENCLAILRPEFIQEWHEKNVISPFEVTQFSHKKVWWNCYKCKHEWRTKVQNRVRFGCPKCANVLKMPLLDNPLHQEFNENKNIICKDYLTLSSPKKVWWTCRTCKHEWQCAVRHRYLFPGCPFCLKKRPSLFYNLLTEFKEISNSWDFSKNVLTPQDFLPYSNKKIWWICQDCKYQWKSSILNRTFNKSCCPNCHPISKGEEIIKNYLHSNKLNYKRQYKFQGCKNKRSLPFDFAVFINEEIYLIEFQGIQHYDKNSTYIRKKPEYFDTIKQNDLIKKMFCQENKFNFLEISYKDIKKIAAILDNYLNKGH